MQVDYLLIGQGICGTLLSWFLHKEGKTFVVIDDERPDTATQVAAGIINPVTGRRYAYSWMIDVVMPFAVATYKEMGEQLAVEAVFSKSIIDFFPSPQMRDAFVTRMTEDDTYLHTYPDQNHFNQYFNFDFGCGEIRPAYCISISLLLNGWRKKLYNLNAFHAERFVLNDLQIEEDSINYKNIRVQKVIFCDGIQAMNNPYFSLLPFSPNKGEAIIIESPELTNEHIFKKGTMLAPLPAQNTFWVGSNYQWEFKDEHPSSPFYEQMNRHLQQWLKVPFRIIDHKAAIRPATLERRPFVGLHPFYPALGILNGMGTKGVSLAPFFAHQFVQHLVYNLPLAEEADVKRFRRILSKQ